MNCFDRFYTTTAVIIELGSYDDYENTYATKEIGVIKGDLQPYSGGLAQEEYGLNLECQYKFFCSASSKITEGRYLRIDNIYYKIMHVSKWGLGYEVLLKSEEIKNDRRK